MDVTTCIEGRTSIRDFRPDSIGDDIIDKALEMANLAPSAGNLQARDFIVVRNERTKKSLKEAALDQEYVLSAPVVVVFCANLERIRDYGERGRTLYCLQDVAAAVENFMLYLHSVGLGTVWIGAFHEKRAGETLGLPPHVRPVAIVPVGVPSVKGTPRGRLPLGQLVHREKW